MELKDKSADEASAAKKENYVPKYKRVTDLTVITDFTSLKSSNEESKGSNGQSSPTFEVFMETRQDEIRRFTLELKPGELQIISGKGKVKSVLRLDSV